MMKCKKYNFIGKCLYFPRLKTLVIGDLHIGYEALLGVNVPLNQTKKTIEELKEIFELLAKTNRKVKKVIFLGDLKHYFGYFKTEKQEIEKILDFLEEQKIDKIVFIRGNHEKNEKDKRYRDFYIAKDVLFIHGHREFPKIYDKNINLIVMGHIHPSITLIDRMKIKKEKYKCFLVGKYKGKEFVVVPSFISLIEGACFSDEKEDFSIIPNRVLKNFDVFVVSGCDVLRFGKLKNL